MPNGDPRIGEDLQRYLDRVERRKQLGRWFQDFGTSALTVGSQFRRPNQEELERGREGGAGRRQLFTEAGTWWGADALTGGAMSKLAPKIVSAATKKARKAVKDVPPKSVLLKKPKLAIKSVMKGSPLEKGVTDKGEIAVGNIKSTIASKQTPDADKFILQKVLDDKFPNQKRVNYKEFQKAIDDELVPLEREITDNYAKYGIERIRPGYLESSIDAKTNTFSNRAKFGQGDPSHFDDHVLGHSRSMTDVADPNTGYILESQSDFYQGRLGKDLKGTNRESLGKLFNQLEDLAVRQKDDLSKAKHIDGAWELPDGQRLGNKLYKELMSEEGGQFAYNKIKAAELSNLEQKQFLGSNIDARLFQENLAVASEQGQKKLRYPTRETAAKIEGFRKQNPREYLSPSQIEEKIAREKRNIVEYDKTIAEIKQMKSLRTFDRNRIEGLQVKKEHAANDINMYKRWNDEVITEYTPEHETVLKKYSDFPKLSKKTIGQEPKLVTDLKGHTWYEVDVNKAYKKRDPIIKALGLAAPAAVGTVNAAVNAQDDIQQFAKGGEVGDDDLRQRSDSLTAANANNPWIKRFLEGNELSIPDPYRKGKPGDTAKYTSTHGLSYHPFGDGQAMIFPEIVQQGDSLVKLSNDEARQYAIDNKTGIITDEELAKYYSENGLIDHDKFAQGGKVMAKKKRVKFPYGGAVPYDYDMGFDQNYGKHPVDMLNPLPYTPPAYGPVNQPIYHQPEGARLDGKSPSVRPPSPGYGQPGTLTPADPGMQGGPGIPGIRGPQAPPGLGRPPDPGIVLPDGSTWVPGDQIRPPNVTPSGPDEIIDVDTGSPDQQGLGMQTVHNLYAPTFCKGGKVRKRKMPFGGTVDHRVVELDKGEPFRTPDGKIAVIKNKDEFSHGQGGAQLPLPIGTEVLGKNIDPIMKKSFKDLGAKLATIKKKNDLLLEGNKGKYTMKAAELMDRKIGNQWNEYFARQESPKLKKSQAAGQIPMAAKGLKVMGDGGFTVDPADYTLDYFRNNKAPNPFGIGSVGGFQDASSIGLGEGFGFDNLQGVDWRSILGGQGQGTGTGGGGIWQPGAGLINNLQNVWNKGKGAVQEGLWNSYALAPVAWNLYQGAQDAEHLNAPDFYNPQQSQVFGALDKAQGQMANRRFDVNPLQTQARQDAAARAYNARTQGGLSSGAIASNMFASSAQQTKDLERAEAMRQNMNNQYLGQQAQLGVQSAGIRGRFGAQQAQTDLAIAQYNQAADAAQRGMTGAGLAQLGQYGQNRQLMQNMTERDEMLMKALQAQYGSNFSNWTGIGNGGQGGGILEALGIGGTKGTGTGTGSGNMGGPIGDATKAAGTSAVGSAMNVAWPLAWLWAAKKVTDKAISKKDKNTALNYDQALQQAQELVRTGRMTSEEYQQLIADLNADSANYYGKGGAGKLFDQEIGWLKRLLNRG